MLDKARVNEPFHTNDESIKKPLSCDSPQLSVIRQYQVHVWKHCGTTYLLLS